MSDQPPKPQSISEISHLFLSGVREKQMGSAPRPVRLSPKARQAQAEPQNLEPSMQHSPESGSVDLTPEEYAQVSAGSDPADRSGSAAKVPPVTAVIAQHLNGRAPQRVRDYARHLAANGERIGLLEVEAGEVRLLCFERSIEPNSADPRPAEITEHFDPRAMSEALEEMSWDVDRWLLVLPNLRHLESRHLLKDVKHWSLLSTCDHDGVVSCYRTLKGLADLPRPRLTLALMEAPSETMAAKVFHKLQSVCLQFLGVELQPEPSVRPTRAVAEHLAAHYRATHDKTTLSSDGSLWKVVGDFLQRASSPEQKQHEMASQPAAEIEAAEPIPHPEFAVRNPEPAASAAAPVEPPIPHEKAEQPAPQIAEPKSAIGNSQSAISTASDEVLDLPSNLVDDQSVLSAIFNGAGADLIECPLRAPMCPSARLAVTRDRGLVLLAVAGKGLNELRAIAQAYRWLIENRALIGMALPQMAIDGLRHPRLRLFVDHADTGAAALAPMLESNTVSVQAYRKLRWGGRTGLLLEAA